MEISFLSIAATACFSCAIFHTFLVKHFQNWARKFPEGSTGQNLLHLLGEVEVVFGIWAGVYLLILTLTAGVDETVHYLDQLNFTEPAFVFVIMTICATRPILHVAGRTIEFASSLMPLNRPTAFYVATMIIGPLLGSLITEPAAMTLTALILLERFYKIGISEKFMYATLGLLFVNISIGGTLTPYAAPPVLMVAAKWNWSLEFMLRRFGWRALAAILISTFVTAYRFRSELKRIPWKATADRGTRTPAAWLSAAQLVLLGCVVGASHHQTLFIGLFLFFLGLVTVTADDQDELKIREGLLVAFFLAGLVVLGGQQNWWLDPILSRLSAVTLYFGAIGLTAFTDNAALTFLGSQVPTLSEFSRFALVAGSVVGGGLTVIANAPNPAGYGILNDAFGDQGIRPLSLLLNALPPTVTAAIIFWI